MVDVTDTEGSDGPPPFVDVFASGDAEQRVYETILQSRDPTSAREIAETADCAPKTARKHLDWFTQLGIVTCHDGNPVTFERNDAYFEWRHINDLATSHTAEELQERIQELTARIFEYEEKYDADSPAEVDAIAVAKANDEWTIDEVYVDLGDWATVREQQKRCKRARQRRTNDDGEYEFE